MIHIGVSACFMYPDSERPFFGPKLLSYIENDMANYLTRMGIIPVLLPNLPHEKMKPLLDKMDGFVFQGGSDISPSSYGESHINKDKWPGDPERDRYELKIMDYAFNLAKPILGICRGCQLINVYFKGTLVQDVSLEINTPVIHRDPTVYDFIHHDIEIIPGGYLENLYGNIPQPKVNSVHHQAIKDVGEDLMIEAISPQDELIEALSYEGEGDKFILGVQWHPEFFYNIKDKLIDADPLYDLFLKHVLDQKK